MNLHLMPYVIYTGNASSVELNLRFCSMVYKSLNGLAPDYLSALIDVRRPTRSLRSCNKLLLNVPKINTVTLWPMCLLLRSRNTLQLYTGQY